MLEWIKLGRFRNWGFARLTELSASIVRSVFILNDRCRSFNISIEHLMVMQNDHFTLRIVLGVF
jgi:hypothetical protein